MQTLQRNKMAEDVLDYRILQEKFVSNHTGTTVSEISIVLTTTVLSVLLRSAVLLVLPHSVLDTSKDYWRVFFLDFPCLIIPTLLAATAYSENLHYLQYTIVTIATGAIIWKFNSLNGFKWKEILSRLKEFSSSRVESRFNFISSFKAYTLIGTVISILAVDFTIFPRRFCKTETYGTGLMDAGVGLFIVSNAVVSPEARNKISTNTNRFYQIYKSIVSSLPLLILGLSRVVATKGVDYQEHVTEYGTHWNFFFTLAAVKILSSFLSCIVPVILWKFVVVFLCVLYQYGLTYRGLSQYIIQGVDGHGGRHGIFDSNREGIISSIGYFILYLFGVEIGIVIFKKERQTVSQYLSLFIVLCVSGIIAFTVLPYISYIEPVSRRFANVPYVIWMLGICLQLIASYLLVDLIFQFIRFLNKTELKDKKEVAVIPVSYSIIEAVNYNALLYFLLANLLTGVINLSMKTILVLPILSLCVIIVYMFVLSFITYFLYVYKLKVKFW